MLFFFVACSSHMKQETLYFQGTIEEAIEKAKQEDKYIFLDFYTEWCGGCKSYDRFVFSDSMVRDYLEANYVFKSVDAEKDEGVDLKDRFEVVAFPTLIIADQDGNEVGRKVGFENRFIDSSYLFVEQVEVIGKGIGSLRSLEQQFENESSNTNLMRKLIEAYKDRGRYKEIERIAITMMNSPDSSIHLEGDFNLALSWIYRKENPNPSIMKAFVETKANTSNDQYFLALDYLKNYYKRRKVNDSIIYYYERRITSDPDAWYEKKNYAQFLFENNLNITRATDLAIEYNRQPYPYTEDFKQSLLMAYTRAYGGEINCCMDQYDEWLNSFTAKYLDEEDWYWSYHYYADFANRFNINLEKALEYISVVVENSGRVSDMLLKGEILYKLNKNVEAEEVLNNALATVSNESQYEHIQFLLESHK
jgi:thioredoxin